MTENIAFRLVEHNNWANLQLLAACETLTEAQLDFQSKTAVFGSIRETLQHIVLSQEDYASMLTTLDHPAGREYVLTFSELRQLLKQSGTELLSHLQNSPDKLNQPYLHLKDGYKVAPWVFLVQVVNHATEHREQIKSIISDFGIEPPRVDGWEFAKQQDALSPPSA